MGEPVHNSTKFLIIPADARVEVDRLLSLDVDMLRALDAALSDKETLRHGGRTYQAIAKALGVGNDDAIGLLSAVRNIRRQCEEFDLDDDALMNDLAILAPHSIEDNDRRTALSGLFRKGEEDHFVEKVASLRHALVPHFIDARTIVEVRPVFTKDRSRVDGMMLAAHLELTTHDNHSEDLKTFTIQLKREDIEKLRTLMLDAEKKLECLRQDLSAFDLYE